MLGIETEIMSSERMDENECKELEKNFQTNNIDKDAVVEFLKANTMRYPYDLRVYALAYLNFGNDAGDLEGITKYLGMYDSFRSYMEENYVSLLKQKLNLTMEGGDCDKLKRDMEFAEELRKKYSMLSGDLIKDIRMMRKRYSAAVGVVGYTTVHSSEEMQRFNAILNDEDLLCFDDTYKNPEHLQKKGMESFEEKYRTCTTLIDQNIYGPISAFYVPDKEYRRKYLAFTPEKLFGVISEEEAVAAEYSEVEVSGGECRVGAYKFEMNSPQLLRELAEWEVAKKIRTLLTSLGTVTEDNLPRVETKPEFVELLKILKKKFYICGYSWDKGPDIKNINDIKNYSRLSDREKEKIVELLLLIGKISAVDDIIEHPEKREEERKKAEEEKIFFADTWNTKTLEERLQHPDIKVSTLAKVECYLCKALDTRKKDTPYCRAYYSLYNKK